MNTTKNETVWTEEQIRDFFEYLTTGEGDGIFTDNALTPRQAFTTMYYLQEKARIIPDNWELCNECECLYDSHCEGVWVDEYTEYEMYPDTKLGGYCDSCFTQNWTGRMKGDEEDEQETGA